MANYRIPGVTGSENRPSSLADGTLSPILAAPPGPISVDWPFNPSKRITPSINILTHTHTSALKLRFIFKQCLIPETGLSEANYNIAAKLLGVEIAAIKAVAEVESSGAAFDEYGRPRILFERHYFHRLTAGKYDAKNPNISNKKNGGYGKFSAQYKKLERAFDLSPDAALRSASWGRFQIMGDNYKAAGFSSAGKFVLALTKSESAHLKAFSTFVGNNTKMLSALSKKDWGAFARIYNGPRYKDNNYDTKLKSAYDRFSTSKP
jgi:hypothetical protein